MYPEIVDMGSKEEEVRSRWGGYGSKQVKHLGFPGTFKKELICYLEDTFSFAHIAQAFEDDNKIYEAKISSTTGTILLEPKIWEG